MTPPMNTFKLCVHTSEYVIQTPLIHSICVKYCEHLDVAIFTDALVLAICLSMNGHGWIHSEPSLFNLLDSFPIYTSFPIYINCHVIIWLQIMAIYRI